MSNHNTFLIDLSKRVDESTNASDHRGSLTTFFRHSAIYTGCSNWCWYCLDHRNVCRRHQFVILTKDYKKMKNGEIILTSIVDDEFDYYNL